MSESTITFKYLQNQMLTLGDGVYHAIPMRQVEEIRNTPAGDRMVMLPHFDLEHPHTVRLGQLTPQIPKRRPEHSESFHERIIETAQIAAIAKRTHAAKIIANLKHLSTGPRPVIEIIADPEGLLTDEFEVSDAERELANLPKQEPARDVSVIRTDELAAEAAALRGVK